MTARLQHIVEANWFHRTIVAVIVLAGVLPGLETSAAVLARHGSLLHTLDALVLILFIAEMALQLLVGALLKSHRRDGLRRLAAGVDVQRELRHGGKLPFQGGEWDFK